MKPARWDDRNKRWEAVVGSGKARRRFCSRTEGEEGKRTAEAKRAAFLDGPEPARPGSLTEFVETTWWPRLHSRSRNTRIKYKSVLDNHIAPLGYMQMNALRLPILQAWVNDMEGQPKTVCANWGVLRSILSLARKMQVLTNTDYELVVLPEVFKKEQPTHDFDEHAKLVEASMGTSMEGPVWCAFNLALRPGEVRGLKVPHVKITGELAVVTVSDNRQAWGEAEKLKNKKRGEVRVLTVPKWMGEKLLSFAQEGAIYMFHTKQGKPMQPAYFSKQIHKLCEKAGVTDLPFKNLRHSCATNLRGQGVPESVISSILGHSKVETSMNYIQDKQEEILDAFTRLASNGRQG